MRLRRAGLVAALAALALAGIAGSHPAPAAADTACPPIPTTLTELMTAAEEIGPLTRDFRPIFGSYPERAAACFGDIEIAFDAVVASPEGLGGARSFHIEPLWLTGMAHFVAVEGLPDAQGIISGPFFPVAVPPALEQQFEDAWQLRVRVRGHFNDRVASSCIVVGGDPVLGRVPTAREALEICRTYFVITSVEAVVPAPSPSTPSALPTPTPSGSVGQPASSGASPLGLALIALAVAMAVGAGWLLRRGRSVAHR